MFRFFTIITALVLMVGTAHADCDPGYTAQTVTVDPATYGLDPDIDGTDDTYDPTAGTWTVMFDYGNVSGISTCNTTSGSWGTAYPQYNFEQGTTGQYCWCKMLRPARSAWVFFNAIRPASDCAAPCAASCADSVRYDSAFRGGVFGSVTEDVCTANTITINWKNATGGTMESNSCTYGGTLTTPATAPTKRGHTFTGWSYQ